MSKDQLDDIIASKGKSKGFFFELSMLCVGKTIYSIRNFNIMGLSIINNWIVAIFAAIQFKNVIKFFLSLLFLIWKEEIIILLKIFNFDLY